MLILSLQLCLEAKKKASQSRVRIIPLYRKVVSEALQSPVTGSPILEGSLSDGFPRFWETVGSHYDQMDVR